MVADADTARDTLIIELRDTLNELLGVLQEREDEPVPNTTQELLEQVQEQRGRRELPEAVRTPFNLSPVPEGVGQPAGGTELPMRRQRRTADDLDLGYREMFPEEGEGVTWFWMRVLSSTGITGAESEVAGEFVEWTYSGEKITLTRDLTADAEPPGEQADPHWVLADGEPGVDDLADNVFNLKELDNRDVGAGGTFGNGVPYDDLVTDEFEFYLKPIPPNIPIKCYIFEYDDVELDDEGNEVELVRTAYRICEDNAVSGECA